MLTVEERRYLDEFKAELTLFSRLCRTPEVLVAMVIEDGRRHREWVKRIQEPPIALAH